MKKTMLVGAAVAALLTFSACGSKSSSSSSGSGSTAAPAAGGDSSSNKGGAWCDKAREADKAMNALDPGKASGPAEIKTMFENGASAIKNLLNGAPSAIKSDVQSMSKALDSMVSIMKKYDYDLTKVAADADFTKLMGDQSIQDSSNKISTYLKDTCGITESTDAPADTTN